MKVTIEIEEKNNKLNIGISEQGKSYTAKERRLVNLVLRTFPKSANVEVVAPKRNCDRFSTWEEAAEAWGMSPEWSECPDSGWAWLFAKVSKAAEK